MKQLQIHTSRDYTVTIGSGLLATIGQAVSTLTQAQAVCLVTDSNLRRIHARTVLNNLSNSGFRVCVFTIPAGEANKNAENYLQLLQLLAREKLTRSDCIIALGGGVVGDLAGFAAATYLRGIPYIQIPTSLLAMVDSSVGGKTGIDLSEGKNLVGAFYQPSAVICDTDALQTLPMEDFRDGCTEVIKYGILYDPSLFSHLEERGTAFDREWVISRCIDWKRQAVEEDELDNGQRTMLNLGHTIGHAVEKSSNFSVTHGKAVAIGIATICRATKCMDTDRVLALLRKFDLPINTDLSAELLADAVLSDKKRAGATMDLIIPHAIGNCRIEPTPLYNIQTLIEEGL